MKKLAVLVAFTLFLPAISGCQLISPDTFTDTLELTAKEVTLEEADNILGVTVPVPAYLPDNFGIKEIYVQDKTVGLLISDEVIEKKLVTHTDAAGTRQWYEFQSKMEMSIRWNSQGVAGGLKLPGDRVMIGETRGVIVASSDHNNLWWQPRPDPEEPGMFEMVVSASKRISKEELVKVAQSVLIGTPGEIEKMIRNGTVKSYNDTNETISASINEEFAISLHVNFRLGPRWRESHNENTLTFVGEDDVPVRYIVVGTKDGVQQFDIVPGIQYFLFKALKSGETEITFIRSQGGSAPVLEQKVFSIDVK